MNDILLLKLGEIILKGLNRRRFEQRLLSNIRWRLSRIGSFRVYLLQSTVYVEGQDPAELEYLFNFITYGAYRVVCVWLNKDDREAPQQIARQMLRFIQME